MGRPVTSGYGSVMHLADSHDFIRVTGARENNLKDVSVEIPKRRLTVFTGVSGSGKSSLVFDTIAAESQRLINETYSAFVQGIMPTLARPEVDLLDGLTTAIIVDQQRMAPTPALPSALQPTPTPCCDSSTADRRAACRAPACFLVQHPDPDGERSDDSRQRQGERTVVRNVVDQGGMCPRCEGMGSVSDIDLTKIYDETKSLNEGAITVPGYKAGGWSVRYFTDSGFLDPDKPINKYTKKELADFLYKEPVKVRINDINLTYEGLVPQIQKSFLSKDVDTLQPHIRDFVERAVAFTVCPDCDGTRLNEAARSSKIAGKSIADLVQCRSATSPGGCANSASRRPALCSAPCRTHWTPSSTSASATCL